jgi:hypothetical protein
MSGLDETTRKRWQQAEATVEQLAPLGSDPLAMSTPKTPHMARGQMK